MGFAVVSPNGKGGIFRISNTREILKPYRSKSRPLAVASMLHFYSKTTATAVSRLYCYLLKYCRYFLLCYMLSIFFFLAVLLRGNHELQTRHGWGRR